MQGIPSLRPHCPDRRRPDSRQRSTRNRPQTRCGVKPGCQARSISTRAQKEHEASIIFRNLEESKAIDIIKTEIFKSTEASVATTPVVVPPCCSPLTHLTGTAFSGCYMEEDECSVCSQESEDADHEIIKGIIEDSLCKLLVNVLEDLSPNDEAGEVKTAAALVGEDEEKPQEVRDMAPPPAEPPAQSRAWSPTHLPAHSWTLPPAESLAHNELLSEIPSTPRSQSASPLARLKGAMAWASNQQVKELSVSSAGGLVGAMPPSKPLLPGTLRGTGARTAGGRTYRVFSGTEFSGPMERVGP